MGRIGKKSDQYPHHEQVTIEESPSTRVSSSIEVLAEEKPAKENRYIKYTMQNIQTQHDIGKPDKTTMTH